MGGVIVEAENDVVEDAGLEALGPPFHSQTQGKIERWHQTLKNRILLENYYLPGDLEARSGPSSITTTIGVTTRPSPT
jgi:hypothetical protein